MVLILGAAHLTEPADDPAHLVGGGAVGQEVLDAGLAQELLDALALLIDESNEPRLRRGLG